MLHIVMGLGCSKVHFKPISEQRTGELINIDTRIPSNEHHSRNKSRKKKKAYKDSQTKGANEIINKVTEAIQVNRIN